MTRKLKREKRLENFQEMALAELATLKLDKKTCRLISAIMFWAEGSKDKSSVTFVNSDPIMISTFIKLLRESFDVDESKFRALIHIHEYHDEEELKKFWSKTAEIPLSQFTKSYRKPHTKKRKRPGYRGCVAIKYYDYKVALRLFSTYNTFAGKILGA